MTKGYLTFKRSKKTGKLIGFLWQGDKSKYTVEQVKELIANWNKSEEYAYTFELCEDNDICDLLKDSEKQKTINDLYYMVDELEGRISSLSSDICDIKDSIKELKESEE